MRGNKKQSPGDRARIWAKERLARVAGAKPARRRPGQAVVCAACGAFLGFAGHVNLDLDLRLHRERAGGDGTTVRVRWATAADVEERDLGAG